MWPFIPLPTLSSVATPLPSQPHFCSLSIYSVSAGLEFKYGFLWEAFQPNRALLRACLWASVAFQSLPHGKYHTLLGCSCLSDQLSPLLGCAPRDEPTQFPEHSRCSIQMWWILSESFWGGEKASQGWKQNHPGVGIGTPLCTGRGWVSILPTTCLPPHPLLSDPALTSLNSTVSRRAWIRIFFQGWVECARTELTLIEMLKELCSRIKQLPLILLPSRWWEQIPACGQSWAAASLSCRLSGQAVNWEGRSWEQGERARKEGTASISTLWEPSWIIFSLLLLYLQFRKLSYF